MKKNEKLYAYCEDFSAESDPLLEKLYRETHSRLLRARMISGPFQGRFLTFFSKMIQPEKILEIGTFTGYSALCLAKGLKENGKLITYEINDELGSMIQKFFEQSENKEQLELRIGNFLLDAGNLKKEDFDLIFIDGDKRQYPEYYEKCFDILKPGGYMIVDNVLWDGKILDKPDDEYTAGIVDLNNRVKEDSRVEKLILPLRDGLMLIRKK